MFSKLLRPRSLVLVILLIIIASLTYGFAATLTTSTDSVAAGTSAKMSDMAVDVTWTLNSTTPDTSPEASLDFTTGSPTTVYAQVQDTSGTVLTVGGANWVSCTGPNPFSCTFTGVNVADIYYIRVSAGE